jgi:hypothetical protein
VPAWPTGVGVQVDAGYRMENITRAMVGRVIPASG